MSNIVLNIILLEHEIKNHALFRDMLICAFEQDYKLLLATNLSELKELIASHPIDCLLLSVSTKPAINEEEFNNIISLHQIPFVLVNDKLFNETNFSRINDLAYARSFLQELYANKLHHLIMLAANNKNTPAPYYTEALNTDEIYKVKQIIQLEQAFINNDMELNYDAIIDINHQSLYAKEAKLLLNKTNSSLSPELWQLANKLGMLNNISKWLIPKAVVDLKMEFRNLMVAPKVIVQLTDKQLADEEIIEFILAVFRVNCFPSSHFIIKLDEESILKQYEFFKLKINELKSLNFTICAANVGYHAANLKHLNELPIDLICLSPWLTSEIYNNVIFKQKVKNIVNEAKSQNISLIAPRVDDEQNFQVLCSLGVSLMQGKYLEEALANALNTDKQLSAKKK